MKLASLRALAGFVRQPHPAFFVFPAQTGIYVRYGHRPLPV
jgi:hypothetical protein